MLLLGLLLVLGPLPGLALLGSGGRDEVGGDGGWAGRERTPWRRRRAGGSSGRRAARGAPPGPFPERSALPILVEKLLAASRERDAEEAAATTTAAEEPSGRQAEQRSRNDILLAGIHGPTMG
jgi:hypothetical protein